MPFAIIKPKIILKILKIYFVPPYQGSEKDAKTHYNPTNKNHCMEVYDSSNEAPGNTDCNAKKLRSLRCNIAEKIIKNHQR